MAMIAIDLRASLAGRDTLPLLHVARDVGIAGTLDACALGQLALDLHVVRHAGTRLAITTNHQRLDIGRSEEHTSELQSLMRISYAVFCLKKKTQQQITKHKEEQKKRESTTTNK